jgi:alkylhydroperoxidase family enzyme
VYRRVAEHFNESEMVALTFAIVVINCWNRLTTGLFRPVVGSYQSKAHAVS